MKRSAWLLLLVSLLNMQCGYRLAGRGRNLPASAKTIAIPEFQNETSRYQAQPFVSAAIREEFIKRSRLRLVAAVDKADLVLEGRIGAFETTPVAYSDHGTAKMCDLHITVHVRLIDLKNNEIVYEVSGLAFRATYETDAVDFFSQAAGSLEKIGSRFAASVVSSILDNF